MSQHDSKDRGKRPDFVEEIDIKLERDNYDEGVEERQINLTDLFLKLWGHRKKLLYWCLGGAVAGLIIAFSIPRTYTAQATMAPETKDKSTSSSSLGALASMAGLMGGGMGGGGSDAVYPLLYPDVVESVPFIAGLFDVKVELEPEEGQTHGKVMTVREYFTEETRMPWWSAIMRLPFKVISMIRGEATEENGITDEGGALRLSKDDWKLYHTLSKNISVSCDKKTFVLSLAVNAQDPLVSAILADTVMNRLQEYITEYRTNKARRDLEYAQQLNIEAQKKYYACQQELADYLDRNQGIVWRSALIERERLENETTLAFNLYNQTSLAVQSAQAKVQDNTPVYAIIQPVTVPEKPSSPKKVMLLVAFTFLGFLGGAFWIIIGKRLWKMMMDIRAKDIEENGDQGDKKEHKSRKRRKRRKHKRGGEINDVEELV